MSLVTSFKLKDRNLFLKLIESQALHVKEDEPYRVSEFREFTDEVPPAEIRHPQSGWIVGVVDRLTFITVVQQPSGH